MSQLASSPESLKTLDGYVDDSLYPSIFHIDFAPPNIDAMLAHAGIASPRAGAIRPAFTMVDIGCGDAAGLILNAAAHPEAHFIGIDGNPDHIARGRGIAAAIGLPNIDLQCRYFEDAIADHAAGSADYVQCQGVLTWVSEINRHAALALAAHLLKPGGALVAGYNCLPGWAPIIAMQHMVRTLGDGLPGTPRQRFAAALAELRKLGLIDSAAFEFLDSHGDSYPADYFAHEYLNTGWRPMWSGDMLDLAKTFDLSLIGQARAYRLRPDFAYKSAWRATLASIENPAARESAADILTNNWFRTDLFIKGVVRSLDDEEQVSARLAGWWMAMRSLEQTEFSTRTTAGVIRFDNVAARTIMAELQQGPRALSTITGVGQADLFNALDALFMAGAVRPVDPPANVHLAHATMAAVTNCGTENLHGAVSPHGVVSVSHGNFMDISDDDRRRLGIFL